MWWPQAYNSDALRFALQRAWLLALGGAIIARARLSVSRRRKRLEKRSLSGSQRIAFHVSNVCGGKVDANKIGLWWSRHANRTTRRLIAKTLRREFLPRSSDHWRKNRSPLTACILRAVFFVSLPQERSATVSAIEVVRARRPDFRRAQQSCLLTGTGRPSDSF